MVKVLVLTDPSEVKDNYPGYDGVFIKFTDPNKRGGVYDSWLTEGMKGREQIRLFDDLSNLSEEIKKGFFVSPGKREPITEVVHG